MLIRLAENRDLKICGEIYAAAFSAPPYSENWIPAQASEMLGELLNKDPENCWCIEEDGQVAGFAFCLVFGRFHASIQEFAISPAFQKRGLGTALMEHVLSDFKVKGVRAIELIANKDATAFKFYRKFGFHQPGRYVLMARWL